MKKLFYMLCLVSPMLYASDASVCTDEIIIDAFASVFNALQDLEHKASDALFKGILEQRKAEFNDIMQQALEYKIDGEGCVYRLERLWANTPRIIKFQSGETMAVYPAFDSQGQIIYRPR